MVYVKDTTTVKTLTILLEKITSEEIFYRVIHPKSNLIEGN